MPTVVKVFRNPKLGDDADVSLDPKTYVTTAMVDDNYVVQYTDGTATPVEAAVATDGTTTIPAIGSVYAGGGIGGSLICLHVVPTRRVTAPSIFDVKVTWKNIPPQGSGARWAINIDVTPIRYEQDAWIDKSVPPKPIMASNKQIYQPTLKKIYWDEEINVSFDCGAAEANNILTATGDGVTGGCKGHYNSEAITLTVNGVARTFGVGTLLYCAPVYSTIYVGEPPYDWKFKLTFQYRVDGWLYNVPDRGTYGFIDLGPGAPERYKKLVVFDAFGTPVSEPVLLNGNGLPLPNVAPGVPQNPVLTTYDCYGGADFTALLAGIS